MNNLRIEILQPAGIGPNEPRKIAIRVGSKVLTRLIRPTSNEPDDYLLAPPAQLAFFLVDNWWRLRWECLPPYDVTGDWRAAHELASIGTGYAWPRVSFWGEGDRVGSVSRSDPPGVVGPVRYITDALLFLNGTNFEEEIDSFLTAAIEDMTDVGSDRKSMLAQFEALRWERDNKSIADWRRIEARLGFDVDEAPEKLIESLGALADRYSLESVEEAASAYQGLGAADTLQQEIEAAEASRVQCDFSATLDAGRAVKPMGAILPWERGEQVAANIRSKLSIVRGPIRNRELASLLGTRSHSLTTSSLNRELPYGLRVARRNTEVNSVLMRAKWSHDRRFELARALGDAIWSEGSSLGPIAPSKTARQKFQRAFAQSLLCPYEDLRSYIGDQQPSDGDLSAAAKHFHVSESVVRTLLVNKRDLERGRISTLGHGDTDPERIAEFVEAA